MALYTLFTLRPTSTLKWDTVKGQTHKIFFYIQVVTLAVYSYFVAALIGNPHQPMYTKLLYDFMTNRISPAYKYNYSMLLHPSPFMCVPPPLSKSMLSSSPSCTDSSKVFNVPYPVYNVYATLYTYPTLQLYFILLYNVFSPFIIGFSSLLCSPLLHTIIPTPPPRFDVFRYLVLIYLETHSF
jgi:hypothetical protein